MAAASGNHDGGPLGLFGRAPVSQGPTDVGSIVVVVLGPPGSGKGTQASLLSERLRLPHISTGDMLRGRIRRGDDFGKRIAKRIDVGHFVPDDWINQLLDERIAFVDCREGFILDGYPRTIAQAERLVARCEQQKRTLCLVQLVARASELARRFAGRRQCERCGALFHLTFQPSLAGASCDRPQCGGNLIAREDDREEFLEQRLTDYSQQTAPVVALLESRSQHHAVLEASAGGPEQIHEGLWLSLFGCNPRALGQDSA